MSNTLHLSDLAVDQDKAIRDALQAELVAANIPHVQNRIYSTRLLPISDTEELPAISIYSASDESQENQDRLGYEIEARVVIVIHVSGLDAVQIGATGQLAVDEILDEIKLAVKKAILYKYQTLNENVFECLLDTSVTSEKQIENAAYMTLEHNLFLKVRYRMQVPTTKPESGQSS